MIYVEPFVGGGNLYFHKKPSIKEVISDTDKGVYNVYKGVKELSADTIRNMKFDINEKNFFEKIKSSNP